MSHPGGAVNGVTPPLFESWAFDLWVEVPLGLAVVVYMRGWRRLHRRVPQRFGTGRLAAFVGGMVAISTALESPLHALGAQWLRAHMVQHLLLRMVAPPLLGLGAPLLPMLSGLPTHLLHRWVGALFAWPALTRSCRRRSSPWERRSKRLSRRRLGLRARLCCPRPWCASGPPAT